MPSLKVIRRRITSVKNTQKITRAMKMVAAARLRRATQRITELRPYAKRTVEVLRSVARGASGGADHLRPGAIGAVPSPQHSRADGRRHFPLYGGLHR